DSQPRRRGSGCFWRNVFASIHPERVVGRRGKGAIEAQADAESARALLATPPSGRSSRSRRVRGKSHARILPQGIVIASPWRPVGTACLATLQALAPRSGAEARGNIIDWPGPGGVSTPHSPC